MGQQTLPTVVGGVIGGAARGVIHRIKRKEIVKKKDKSVPVFFINLLSERNEK